MSIKFTMVMPDELARKMTYIGRYYGRRRIQEINWACKEWVQRYEAEHGPISSEDMTTLEQKEGV